jgi:hypothetical protein
VAIALAQNSGDLPGNAASKVYTFGTAPVVGNLIVVCTSAWGLDPPTVTDTAGNTYTRHQGISQGGVYTTIFSARVASSPASVTITTPSSQDFAHSVTEWSGLANPAYDTGTTAGVNDRSPLTVGPTATLAQADELVITTYAANTGSSASGITAPSGYTLLAVEQDYNSYVAGGSAYAVVSATAGVSAAWTETANNVGDRGAALATFKAAAGGGDVTVALTGVAATGAAGTVRADKGVTLTGVTGTGGVGTVVAGSPDVNLTLTGVQAVGQAGSVGYDDGTAPTHNPNLSSEIGGDGDPAPRRKREVYFKPWLARVLEARDLRAKPVRDKAAKKAKALEVQAAEALLEGDGLDIGALEQRWANLAPVLPDDTSEAEAFAAQVRFRLEQMGALAELERLAREALRKRNNDAAALLLLLA